MSSENQYALVLCTSPGRSTNANEAGGPAAQDRKTGVKERLNSFISPANTVLPASMGPGVYTPTCKWWGGPRGAEQDTEQFLPL